jgi:hypothetical protein
VMLTALRLTGAAALRPAQANDEERRRAALARARSRAARTTRGGESAEGARRTILITGQEIPPVVLRRLDHVYRLTRAGILEPETV